MNFKSLAVISTLALVGCATNNNNDDAVDAPASTDGQDLTSAIDVPNPSGTYFASVTANGTGCPAGSWDAAISPDGQAFTLTFSSYEAMVNPGQAFSIKDCTVGIDLHSPNGLSFAVSDFSYQGYAFLDTDGMSISQSAKYYFSGNPMPGELRKDITGPYDDSYLFSDEILTKNLIWSPCGQNRRLNALTRLTLKNDAAKTGSGYTNTSAVDGEVGFQFVFGLHWRHC